jgi:predicted transcriptional regulator
MTDSNAARFLDTFAALEKFLRKRVGDQKGMSFAGMVERAAKNDPGVRRFEIDLKELADLRNAIVHERTDGHPIADPYPETVAWIERVFKLIDTPPRVDAIAAQDVHTCRPGDAIGTAAGKMYAGSFSQLPVIEDNTIRALLTAETIARWVGASLRDGIGLIEETDVHQVLAFTEDPEHHWHVIARDATVFDALAVFDHFSERGWSLDALLITEAG